MSPRFSIANQRRLIDLLSLTVPAIGGVLKTELTLNGVKTDRLDSKRTTPGQSEAKHDEVAVLYLHGGGFVLGSPWCYRALTTRLTRWTGMPVFVPDYRLAPEHPHPAQLDDAISCIEALEGMGWPSDRLIIAGDSAGGNLSLATTQWLVSNGRKVPLALALISPWADASATGNTSADDAVIDPLWIETLRPLIGSQDLLKTPAMSPLYGSFEHFPPTLIQSAGGEVIAPIVQELVERMQAERVAVNWTQSPGLWHDFQLHAGTVPEAAQSLRDMCDFIVKRAEKSS